MLQKLGRFLLNLILVMLIVAVLVLGVVLWLRNNEAVNLTQENLNLKAELDKAKAALMEPVETNYKDVGQAINFDYPSSWVVVADTQTTLSAATGLKQITSQSITLSQAGSDMTIKFTPPTGLGLVQADAGVEAKELKGDLARVKFRNTNEWHYVTKTPCTGVNTTEDTKFCFTMIVTGFGNSSAKTVVLEGNPQGSTLEEADEIVQSAQ